MNKQLKITFTLVAVLLVLIVVYFSGAIRIEHRTRVLPFEADKFGDENFIFNVGNHDNAFNDGNLNWVSINFSGGQYSDAHLITKRSESILIDTGRYQNRKENSLVQYLEENGVSYLSTIYLTSFSPESYGGLREILLSDDISIGSIKINMPSFLNSSQEKVRGNRDDPLDVIMKMADYKNVSVQLMKPNEKYEIDKDTFVEVLHSYSSLTTLPNEQIEIADVPFVAMLSDYENRFLITGDDNALLEHYFSTHSYDVDVATIPLSADNKFVPSSFLDNVVAKDYLATSSFKYWKKLKSLQLALKERSIDSYVNGIDGHVTVVSNQESYTVSVSQ